MITIERALKTPGWMSEAELTYIANLASRSRVVVELGSWRGRSAVCWAENLPPDGKVICIDTWEDSAFGCENFPGDTLTMKSQPGWLMEEFLKHTSHVTGKIITLRTTTLDGMQHVRDLEIVPDVVFIDAAHDASAVEADIAMAFTLNPKVVAGHDYGYSGWPDVKEVVDRMIPKFKVIDSLWTTETA